MHRIVAARSTVQDVESTCLLVLGPVLVVL
jgi:hypothetical protein